MLQGDYLEGDREKLEELPPFTAVFTPREYSIQR
jgi:hypothetical protein